MLATSFNQLVAPSYYRIGINYASSIGDEEQLINAMQDYFDNLDYIAPREQHEQLKSYWNSEYTRQTGKIFVYDEDAKHNVTAPF